MVIMNTWGQLMEDAGYTYSVQSAEGDTAKYISLIEDYVQSGDTAIMLIAAEDTEALADACQTALDAGIYVIMLGVEPEGYTISGGLNTDYGKTGEYAVEMALAWIEENSDSLPDDSNGIPVAINTYYNSVNSTARSEAFKDIEGRDNCYVSYEQSFYDDMTNTAYNFAETALTMNSNTRIFLCYEPDSAKGVDQYLQVYCPENDLDIQDFCVICCYVDDTFAALVESINSGETTDSAVKGYVTYGGTPAETGTLLADCALGLLTGEYQPPYWVYDPINGTSTFGWSCHWEQGMD